MAYVHFGLITLIALSCYSDAAQIVSPASDTLSVAEGSDVQLICHSSPDEGTIVWSYNGMPVDPQSPSVGVSSEQVTQNGQTVVVNTLVLHSVSVQNTRRITYTCKPQDDILNLNADEIELIITTTNNMRLTEAQSSSTLVLQSGAQLLLHCAGEAQSRPVWYYNNEQLAEVSQTSITVAVNTATNTRQSVLTRTSDGIDGQYQCRDGNGYQANSDVLLVMYASN